MRGAEALDVSHSHRSAHGSVGGCILLLSFPQQVLSQTAAEFALEHQAASRFWRHGWWVDVGGSHGDGFGPGGLLAHHQTAIFLR